MKKSPHGRFCGSKKWKKMKKFQKSFKNFKNLSKIFEKFQKNIKNSISHRVIPHGYRISPLSSPHVPLVTPFGVIKG